MAVVRYRPTLTETSPSVNQLNSDVLQVCLLLEGVTVFAQVRVHLFYDIRTHLFLARIMSALSFFSTPSGLGPHPG